MRSGVDIQEAATLGNFVWTTDHIRGGNDGVQQRGEITERVGNASRIVPTGSDGHGTEWRNFQRKSYTESSIGFRREASLVADLHFRESESEGLNRSRLTKSLALRAIARCSEPTLFLGVVRRY